jgi:2-aminomuconate deaminase
MKGDFSVFNKIYSDYFKEHQPCRTTVEVNALPTPIAIELKCIAVVD